MSKYNFSYNIRLKKEVKELIEELKKFDEDVVLRKLNGHYVAVTYTTETPFHSFKNQNEIKGWLLSELRYKKLEKAISKNKSDLTSFHIRRFWGDFYRDALESLTEKQFEKIIEIVENYNHKTIECVVDNKRIYATHSITHKQQLDIIIN